MSQLVNDPTIFPQRSYLTFEVKQDNNEQKPNDFNQRRYFEENQEFHSQIQDFILLENKIRNLVKKLEFNHLTPFSGNKVSFQDAQELAALLKGNSHIKSIDFTGCQLTDLGVNSIIELISYNQSIEEIHLGKITDKALRYLGYQLTQDNNVQHIGIQEDLNCPWTMDTKEYFLKQLRESPKTSKIISFIINVERIEEHALFIGQIELFCERNRKAYLQQRSNEFKTVELDPEHPDYYYPDNFKQNAYKFSVKSYLSNVFESLLDEGLYFLEKERQNVLRDEEIQKVTNEIVKKTIQEDICTADGSIMVLAKYLIGKTKK